jgi:autotransporter-associated beta strand protein
MFTSRLRFVLGPALIVAVSLLGAVSSLGTSWVWTGGGGGNGNWNNSANWGTLGTPGNGDTVVFQGTTGLNTTNNIPNLSLNQIRFISTGFNIYGLPFTITNSIVTTNFFGGAAIYASFTNSTGNLTLLVSNGITLAVYGNISGAVGVTKNGLGTVLYQCLGDNPYTGTTLVNAGTLELNAGGAQAFSGALVIGDGSGTGSPVVVDLQYQEIPDSGAVTVNLGGLLNLNNNAETIGSLTVAGGTVSSGTAMLTVNGNLTVPGSSATAVINGNLTFNGGLPIISVTQGTPPLYALNISANVYDNGNGLFFTNSAAGAPFVVLGGSNTVTGTITANNLILSPTTSYSLGATNPVTIGNGGNLWLYSSTFNNKTLTLTGGATLTAQYNNTWNGPIILNGNVNVYGYGGVGIGTLNLAGPISGVGNISASADSSNWFLLLSGSSANTFSGDLYLQLGTLELEKSYFDGAIPGNLYLGDATHSATNRYFAVNQIGNSSTVTLNDGSLLDLNGYYDGVGSLVLSGASVTMGAGGFLNMYSPGTLVTPLYSGGASTIAGTLGLLANVTALATNDLNISAVVNYGSNLIKDGPGTLTLSGANTYTGLTLVQQGFLVAANALALGATNAGTVVSSGATLELAGGITIANETLTLNGPGNSIYWGSLDVETGVNTWAGPIINNGGSTLDAWNAGSQLHISGPISGPGSLELFGYSGGGGTHYFDGTATNTYAGTTTVDGGCTLDLAKSTFYSAIPGNVVVAGTLRLAANEQIVQSADVQLNPGSLWDFGAYYQDINTLHGAGSVTFGTDGYLNIGADGGSSTFAGTLSGIGYPDGYTVGKFGTGTFTLTGTNTYLNETEVFAGTMQIDGSQLTSPVAVSFGSFLTGTGVVGSISAYGTVEPGDSGTGILSCSNIAFNSFGVYKVKLDGPAPGTGYSQLNPLIQIGSNILGNASLYVAPAFTAPVAIGQQFTIISNATGNLFSGTFSGLPEGAQFSASGYTFDISYVGGTGKDVVLTLLGVPQNTVTVNAFDRGFFDNTGTHYSWNSNYFAGSYPTPTNVYRDFFIFNIPVSTNSIVHAELLVDNYQVASPYSQQTYMVHKVTTPIATLEASAAGLVGVYNDLGTGAVYSVRGFATNEAQQISVVPLNAQFINDATAAAGGQLAIGGTIVSLTTNTQYQYLFGGSTGVPNDVQLRLVYGTNMVIASSDRGWYSSAGVHTAGNYDYFVGDNGAALYRNYFVFNLPAISSQLVDAELLVNSYVSSSSNSFETYQLYDVTNAISALTNGQSSATGIYADLGSGTVYGGRDVYMSESDYIAGIPLNHSFITAAQANSGGRIALGGALTSLSPVFNPEYLFAYSVGNPSDVQLWLGYYKQPITHPAFVSATPTYLGSNEYQFTVSGASGTPVEIQASFDFQHWDYITDVTPTASPSTFIYTNSAPVPYRFFRAEELQP